MTLTETPYPVVRLSRPFKLSHPWIFSRLVLKPEGRIPPGTVVDVVGPDGAFVGRGFYNARTRIGVRILTTDQNEPIDRAFFARRIGEAVRLRRDQLALFGRTNALRLVHSEGDRLSGLIVDLYGDVLALQYFAAGMFRMRETIMDVLKECFPSARFYWFAEARVQKQESFDCWEVPRPEPVVIEEQGVRFHVAVGSMHKTGFFTDQRDNRLAIGRLAGPPTRVLDLCCNTGGFALYAKVLGKAAEVTAIDLDDEALKVARANAALNDVEIDFQAADIFAWLQSAATRGDSYDLVVLDPAKQTRSAERVDGALAQYFGMNRLAMQVVKKGGILLTCSCSGLITEEQFLDVIRRAAHVSGRHAQIFQVSGAAEDHPFLANVPESRYLKAVYCRVL